jgi:hypothetical protein
VENIEVTDPELQDEFDEKIRTAYHNLRLAGLEIQMIFNYLNYYDTFYIPSEYFKQTWDHAVEAAQLVDMEPPVTEISFDPATAKVSLTAIDYPLEMGSGVAATYYRLDGGATEMYIGAFSISEGTHTVEFWSVDNVGNEESHKTEILTADTTPPTVELTSPEENAIYIFGNKTKFPPFPKTLCIGKVPVAARASDVGSGVYGVLFNFSNGDSGFDDSSPYEYTFKSIHFGELTITATAIDRAGLKSSSDEMTVTVFSLGLS